MPSATREIEINVTPDELMGVITDFESYPEFIPEMVSARIVRQQRYLGSGFEFTLFADWIHTQADPLSPTRIGEARQWGVQNAGALGTWWPWMTALELCTIHRGHPGGHVFARKPGEVSLGKPFPMLAKFKDGAESTVGA